MCSEVSLVAVANKAEVCYALAVFILLQWQVVGWLEQGRFCAKLGETRQMLPEMFGTFAMKSQNGQSNTP